MDAEQIMKIARKYTINKNRDESAVMCYRDAMLLMVAGHEELAKKRALKSLQYSVGVFHQDYCAACA